MIIIIGAGISGLALAYELQQRGAEYLLLEGSDRPGGLICSRRDGDYLFEFGPNSILLDDATADRLGQVVPADAWLRPHPVSEARYIYRRGAYQKLPTNPAQLLTDGFFSPATRVALVREPFRPARSVPDETLQAFITRRFSREVADYALNPFVAGVYAGDPRRLLTEKAFPLLVEMEREHGSVIKGMMKRGGAGRRQSYSFRDGLQTLTDALARAVRHKHYQHHVRSLTRTDAGFLLDVQSPEGLKTLTADRVVISTPPAATQRLLQEAFPDLSAALGRVRMPPMVGVYSAYKRADVKHPLDGFGGLHPHVEGLFSSGTIWSSSVFAHRCPADEVLLTTFVGGELNRAHAELPDADVADRVHTELRRLYGIRARQPVRREVYRWAQAIPQYDLAIKPVYAAAAQAEAAGLLVCANWKDGVSLSDCLGKAQRIAEQLAPVSAP